MCMSYVNEKFNKPSKEVGYGYKVFKKVSFSKKLLNGMVYGSDFPIDKWIEDHSIGGIWSTYGIYYEKGFHIHKTREAARLRKENTTTPSNCVVRKVKYTNVVAKGNDRGKCVIARKMMILSPKKAAQCPTR